MFASVMKKTKKVKKVAASSSVSSVQAPAAPILRNCIRAVKVRDPEEEAKKNAVAATSSASSGSAPSTELFEDEVCAVVVTMRTGSSYDELFEKVPQKLDSGFVSVYAVDLTRITPAALCHYLVPLEEEDADGTPIPAAPPADLPAMTPEDVAMFALLREEIKLVDPGCVVINFECCSGCSAGGISSGYKGKGINRVTRRALNKGFMTMFSDFSLKALIHEWDEKALGPKVFKKHDSSISSSMGLRFKPEDLTESPSAQLAAVGELCNEGSATVSAMSDTILYGFNNTVDAEGTPLQAMTGDASTHYKTKVLTRVIKADARSVDALGHVSLTYPSGGVLLTSAGHWYELQNLNTSVEAVERVMREQMCEDDVVEWRAEYESAPVSAKRSMLGKKAAKCVQQSAPCKTKKSSKY